MRSFLSITPDADSALAIERWSSLCWPAVSRLVSAQNYHLTLVFLGEINSEQLGTLQEMLDNVQHPSFEMSLNEVGYWPESTTLWLAPGDAPEALCDLAVKCKSIANRLGIKAGKKRYHPHLTLARKTKTPPAMPLIEADFKVQFDSFQLYQSLLDSDGVRYKELQSWALT